MIGGTTFQVQPTQLSFLPGFALEKAGGASLSMGEAQCRATASPNQKEFVRKGSRAFSGHSHHIFTSTDSFWYGVLAVFLGTIMWWSQSIYFYLLIVGSTSQFTFGLLWQNWQIEVWKKGSKLRHVQRDLPESLLIRCPSNDSVSYEQAVVQLWTPFHSYDWAIWFS